MIGSLRLILFAITLLFPLCAFAQDLTEQGLLNRADDALSKNDFPAALAALDEAVHRFPESKNEQTFHSLAKLCDTYGLDYEKAIAAYRLYAQRFPNGRFSVRFRDRLAQLESRRGDWSAMQQFIQAQGRFDRRNPSSSLPMFEKILLDHPNAGIKPDIHLWLGMELYRSGAYLPARKQLDLFLSISQDMQRLQADRTKALVAYIEVASKLKDYPTALAKAEQLKTASPTLYASMGSTLAVLRFNHRAQQLNLAAITVAFAAILCALATRPWKDRTLLRNPILSLRVLGVTAAISLAPLGILRVRAERAPVTFWFLAASACFCLVLIRVSSPWVCRIGRSTYGVASTLVTVAFAYLSFYHTDTVELLPWFIDNLRKLPSDFLPNYSDLVSASLVWCAALTVAWATFVSYLLTRGKPQQSSG